MLLQHNIDKDSRDVDEQTSLSWAACRGHEEVVRFLLDKGANPDTKDKDGMTPLSWAASNGWMGIVQLLLERHVDPNSTDRQGRAPLSWVAENGHDALMGLLINKGAQLHLRYDGSHVEQCPHALVIHNAHCMVPDTPQQDVAQNDYATASGSFRIKRGLECALCLSKQDEALATSEA
ncbi:ankyrin repeat domain-containing protein [Aspergillus alliaceus]|uniref:ankyrin repeat domain-containing protein n=1 Tax=Petromyces alliaceus TaxID=209559 RepID=UPI0012A41EB2|nr:ankyrin repeat-containing domain protein [Aspergillus alliaceus]KAB8238206.1 ankyrin repeat-containing domain protein [Aspergillus alliaceus]